MEQKGGNVDQEAISCAICSDLMKDPVTIPCGHSYCMSCIKTHWNMETTHSCPQCRQIFKPRPVLVKNTMLADLVEQLKKTDLGPAVADHCYAGAEDVACDVCTGRKLKAVQSCLVCLVSYCHQHLQPHHYVPQFKKHTLVDPSEKLQENICSRHGEVMKMFCRSDHQCICYLCSVDEHRGHDTVSAAVERTEKQTELKDRRQTLLQRIKDKQENVKELQQEAKTINRSADEVVKKSNKALTDLTRLLEERRRDMEQQIRSQQEREVIRVKELESKLEQEIAVLKRKDAEMDKLVHTDNHNQFLLQYPSVSKVPEDRDSTHIQPQTYFEDVTTAVTELREKLQTSLREECKNISLIITQTQVQLQPQEVLPSPQLKVLLRSQRQVLPPPQPQVLPPPPPQVLPPPQPQVLPPPQPQVLPPPQPQVQPPPQSQALTLPQVRTQSQQQNRTAYVRYSREITLDPNTVNEYLSLSGDNKTVTLTRQKQKYRLHPNRFSVVYQVLSKESLTDRCYWEVKMSGGGVGVAVSYKDIKRKGTSKECGFGFDDKSWVLYFDNDTFLFRHNGLRSPVPGPVSTTIGVYLDHSAGLLSFYSISATMTLIHRVQTSFTHPLYAGIWVWNVGSTAHVPKLR